jgi:hypothetical protein
MAKSSRHDAYTPKREQLETPKEESLYRRGFSVMRSRLHITDHIVRRQQSGFFMGISCTPGQLH